MKPKKAIVERIATITPITSSEHSVYNLSNNAPKDAEHPEGGAYHQAAYRKPYVLRHLLKFAVAVIAVSFVKFHDAVYPAV